MNLLLALSLLLGGGDAPAPDPASRLREALLGLPGAWSPQERKDEPAFRPAGVRTKRTLEDLKGLADDNLFSPPRKKDDRPKDPAKDPVKEAPKPRMLSVTGFVFHEAGKRYEALVEDREWNDKEKKYAVKEIRFVKAGDELAGGSVVEVTAERLVLKSGEKSTELKAGDQVAADGSSTSRADSHEPAAPDTPVDPKAKEDALKRLKDRLKREPPPEDPSDDPAPRRRNR